MLRPLLLALAMAAAPSQELESIVLEIRIFDGATEVSAETRITVHRTGERTSPVAQMTPREGRLHIDVPPGIYDVQAIRERGGRVVSIRWAERLVVMPYPDEGGRHLEVVNFKNGYGALQVRASGAGALPDVSVYAEGEHDKPVAAPLPGDGYVLFVLPAGRYDIQTRMADQPAWHTGIDVPLDRTRLWLVPTGSSSAKKDQVAARRPVATPRGTSLP